MTISIPSSGLIDLNHFDIFLDISKVHWYALKEKDGILVLKFYDKQKRIIKLYANKEKSKKNSKKRN